MLHQLNLLTLCAIKGHPKTLALVKNVADLCQKLKYAKIVRISGFVEIRWSSINRMLKLFKKHRSLIGDFVSKTDAAFSWKYLSLLLALLDEIDIKMN